MTVLVLAVRSKPVLDPNSAWTEWHLWMQGPSREMLCGLLIDTKANMLDIRHRSRVGVDESGQPGSNAICQDCFDRART